MFSFDEVPKKLWIKYPDMDAYEAANEDVMNILATSEGIDQVILYIEKTRQMKKLPANQNVKADDTLLRALEERLGKENVKLV